MKTPKTSTEMLVCRFGRAFLSYHLKLALSSKMDLKVLISFFNFSLCDSSVYK